MNKVIKDLIVKQYKELQGEINHAGCAKRRHQATVDMFTKKEIDLKALKKTIEDEIPDIETLVKSSL